MGLVDSYSQKQEELIYALMLFFLVENCHLSLMGCDVL